LRRSGRTALTWLTIYAANSIASAQLSATPQPMPFSNSSHPSTNPTQRNSAPMHPAGYSITNLIKARHCESRLTAGPGSLIIINPNFFIHEKVF